MCEDRAKRASAELLAYSQGLSGVGGTLEGRRIRSEETAGLCFCGRRRLAQPQSVLLHIYEAGRDTEVSLFIMLGLGCSKMESCFYRKEKNSLGYFEGTLA